MDMKRALTEVTTRTKSLALGTSAEVSSNGFQRHFIRVPQLRKIEKHGYSFYSLPSEQVLKIWDHIWQTTAWYEVACQALYHYQHKSLTEAEFNTIKTWVNRCDCWEHSDDLSKIYARVVEESPQWIIPIYESWNIAKSPWKRRQSVVGLIEYASTRKRILPFDELIRFITPLLQDPDYYVQKAVGWTLRETYNAYPKQTLAFIEQKVDELSAHAFSSATEKIDKKIKTHLKTVRKTNRLSAAARADRQ